MDYAKADNPNSFLNYYTLHTQKESQYKNAGKVSGLCAM
jgi:hypothetical protein